MIESRRPGNRADGSANIYRALPVSDVSVSLGIYISYAALAAAVVVEVLVFLPLARTQRIRIVLSAAREATLRAGSRAIRNQSAADSHYICCPFCVQTPQKPREGYGGGVRAFILPEFLVYH